MAAPAAARTASNIPAHYLRILRRWPTDAVRPLTVQDATRRRIAARLSLPTSSTSNNSTTTAASPPTSTLAASPASTTAPATTSTPPPPPKASDAAQLNALYSLLSDRYAARYPTSPAMLQPASRPNHYHDLMRELDEAPRRSWFAKKWLRWSKLVRFD